MNKNDRIVASLLVLCFAFCLGFFYLMRSKKSHEEQLKAEVENFLWGATNSYELGLRDGLLIMSQAIVNSNECKIDELVKIRRSKFYGTLIPKEK